MKNKGDMIKKGLGGKNQKILPFLDVKSSKSAESVYRSIPIHWQVICEVNLTKKMSCIFMT